MIGTRLSSGLFMSFSSRRCIFLCFLISPSALNDHHPGEREEQSLLVTFLPNRDQGWTAAPCNIFIISAQAWGRENSMSFLFCSTLRCVWDWMDFYCLLFATTLFLILACVSLCKECYKENRFQTAYILTMRSFLSTTLISPDSGKSYSMRALVSSPGSLSFTHFAKAAFAIQDAPSTRRNYDLIHLPYLSSRTES